MASSFRAVVIIERDREAGQFDGVDPLSASFDSMPDDGKLVAVTPLLTTTTSLCPACEATAMLSAPASCVRAQAVKVTLPGSSVVPSAVT